MTPRDRASAEGGFAMLLVFLLAGMIAISLYMEMPRVVFEAQRGREQLLVDRGEQYKRAIQLYYRQFRRYPPDLDALENTNNRRFLRRRFKDPMTQKDEWRLIHGLPNGVFTDSLVYKAPGQAGKDKESTETAAASAGDTPVSPWMQRRPSDGTVPPAPDQMMATAPAADDATDDNGTPVNGGPGQQAAQVQPGFTPPLPGQVQPGQLQPGQIGTATGMPGMPFGPGVTPGMPPVASQPGQNPGLTVQPQIVPGMPFNPNQPGPQTPGAPGQPAGAQNQALEMIRQMLTTPNPRGAAAVQMAGPQQPTAGTPGIAGVASNLEAEGIMVYNDRTKINEWEFIYDARLDTSTTVPPGVQGGMPNPQGGPVPDNRSPGGFGQGPGFGRGTGGPGGGLGGPGGGGFGGGGFGGGGQFPIGPGGMGQPQAPTPRR